MDSIDTPAEKPKGAKKPVSAAQREANRVRMAEWRERKAEKREERIANGQRPTPVRKGTKAGISADIRLMVLTALNHEGGIKYLIKQARKPNPVAFLNLLGKCLTQDDGSGDKEITFLIQQINVSAAPVSGVLASPISQHIQQSPVRLVSNGGALEAPDLDG